MLSRIWSLCYVLALALSFVQALPQLGSSSQPGPRKANVPPNGIVGYMKVLPTGQDMIPWDGWLDSSGQVTTQKCDRSKFQVNNGVLYVIEDEYSTTPCLLHVSLPVTAPAELKCAVPGKSLRTVIRWIPAELDQWVLGHPRDLYWYVDATPSEGATQALVTKSTSDTAQRVTAFLTNQEEDPAEYDAC